MQDIERVVPQLPAQLTWFIKFLKDTPYGDRALHLDIFHPEENMPSGNPAVVLIHGGG